VRACPSCLNPLPAGGFYATVTVRGAGVHTMRTFCDEECWKIYTGQLRDNFYAMTHEEIAQEMGISRQAVQKLEKSGLKKLRRLNQKGKFL